MRHRIGPTKRLVPSMNPETSCPHRFVDDEIFQLEIECEQCSGANDLTNPVCLSRTVNAACYGASVEAIVLKRTIHKRYRGGIVHLVARLAAELAAMNREIASCNLLSDKKCLTCPASTRQVLGAAKRRLLEEPFAYATSKEKALSELIQAPHRGRCERSADCVARAVGFLRGW